MRLRSLGRRRLLGRREGVPGAKHACQPLLGGVVEVEDEWKRILDAGDGRTGRGRSVNGVELILGLEKLFIVRQQEAGVDGVEVVVEVADLLLDGSNFRVVRAQLENESPFLSLKKVSLREDVCNLLCNRQRPLPR
jgi:hypothetical protein